MTETRSGVRLLVIGSTDLSDAVCRALPAFDVDSTTSPLDGVWRVANERFDAVLLSLSQGERVPAAIRSLRELAPAARIVLSCPPADESLTRGFLDRGADDYVLEPLMREEVETAFGMNGVLADAETVCSPDGPIAPEMDAAPANPVAPEATRPCPPASLDIPSSFVESTDAIEPDDAVDSVAEDTNGRGASFARAVPSQLEIESLAEIMKRLSEGPQATLDRLAHLVQVAFASRGASIEIDGRSASAGRFDGASASQSILREGATIGTLSIAQSDDPARTDPAPRLAQYAALIDAVMQQADEQGRWRRLAETDELSGLANRRLFDARVEELVADAMHRRRRLTLFVFDIDNFKAYNDRHGHATGDSLIREIGMLLRRCTREGDVAARIGGDEFAVLFCDFEKQRVAGSQHPVDPLPLAERFCAAISAHDFKCLGRNAPGPVTVSGGLATLPWDAREPRELVEAADRALLLAKQSGKNRIMLASGHGDGSLDREE